MTTEEASIAGNSIYKATYTVGPNGWRVIPRATPAMSTVLGHEFLAVFGGSIAFGLGLQDDETISAYLASEFSNCSSYLFAVMGYGTANIYALLQNELKTTVAERTGVGLYILFTGHLNRVEGTLRTAQWAEHFPYYRLTDNNQLRRFDSLFEVSPCRQVLFSYLNTSKFLSRVHFNWPNNQAWERPETVKLTAALIDASAKSFSDQFPGSPFYVVFYPRADSKELAAAMCPYLEAAGVPYMTMHGILDSLSEDERTVDGGHPTAIANKIVADEIAKQLKVLGLSKPEVSTTSSVE